MATIDEAEALVKQALEDYLKYQVGKEYIPLKSVRALRNYFKIGPIYRQDISGSDAMVMIYNVFDNKYPTSLRNLSYIYFAYAWKGRNNGEIQVSSSIATISRTSGGFVDTTSNILNTPKWILWEPKSETFINWIKESPFRGDK